MYFQAVAIDYDGTLARDGAVAPQTLAALKKCKEGGRKLVLVTGRQVDDLRKAFPDFATFDLIVGENGAVIFNPATCEERAIAETPPQRLVQLLRERGVTPLSVGKCIVATREPHEKTVLETIRDLGLELQIIFNKGAVMILPAGVNKAAGLEAVALDLELSLHNIVAVGDAENDFSFMRLCGCAAAVANALPVIKDGADIRLSAENGEGVVELLDRLSSEDVGLIPARP